MKRPAPINAIAGKVCPKQREGYPRRHKGLHELVIKKMIDAENDKHNRQRICDRRVLAFQGIGKV